MVRVKKRPVHLHGDEALSMPQVIGQARLSFDDLVDLMSDGGRVATTEIKDSFTRLQQSLIGALGRGNRVETPVGTFSISLGVGTRNEDGTFDLKSENARVNFRPSVELLEAVRDRIEFVEDATVSTQRPMIECLENRSNAGCTDTVRPAELIYLRGKNLNFNHASPVEGVFFIAEDGAETRVATYGKSGARQVIFVVPGLTPGTYTLELRALRADERTEVGLLKGELAVELA